MKCDLPTDYTQGLQAQQLGVRYSSRMSPQWQAGWLRGAETLRHALENAELKRHERRWPHDCDPEEA